MAIAKENFNKQFQDYIRIIYEGRWYIIIIFVIVVSATWIYTLQQADIYSAKSSIRVKRVTDILSPGNIMNQDLGWGGERIISNEIRVLKSGGIAIRVAEKLLDQLLANGSSIVDTLPILKAKSGTSTLRNIFRSLHIEQYAIALSLARLDTSNQIAKKEVIAARIQSMTTVLPVRDVDFIEVTVESPSPREAAIVTNTITEIYLERNLESARQVISTARNYLEEQRNAKKDSLRTAEQDVKAFQQEQGIVSLDIESQGLITQLSTFEAQREQSKIELHVSLKFLTEYQNQLTQLEPNVASKQASGISDPLLKKLMDDKFRLEVELSKADYQRKMMLKTRPDMEGFINSTIAELEGQYKEIVKKIEQATNQMLASNDVTATPIEQARELKRDIIKKQIEIESLKAKITRLDQTIQEYSRKFDALPEQSINFARLERARQSNEKLYSLLEQKFQETTISEQTTMGNAEVFDVAVVPTKPTRPNRPMNMLLGAIVALGLGFGVAVVIKYLDTTLRNPEDVEKLGFPVLTFIPAFTNKNDTKRSETLIAYAAPQSPAAEAFRTLRTSVENTFSRNGQSLVMIITSPAPKEGKSTVAANLAVSSAFSGRRVLLIDSDLRRPVLHSIMEMDREPGLTDCLIGAVPVNQCIRKTHIPGLHLVPSGHIPSHPAELLGSERTLKFLAVMRKHYDFILLDSPPIIAMADTLVLARHTDGIALVVSADSTKTLGLEKANQILEANGAKVVGVIVNRFNATKIYYSYYRYYYQNYYYYSEEGTKRKNEARRGESHSKRSAS